MYTSKLQFRILGIFVLHNPHIPPFLCSHNSIDSSCFEYIQNGDYPFKMGTYMGSDAAGNRYYENRVDYVFGQHRWVEPGDIHNFDSSSVQPEWHGWMLSMHDAAPPSFDSAIEEQKKHIIQKEHSDAPSIHNIGHQEKYYNFHHLVNQSQVRSRGHNIGNPVVGLPPGAPHGYYTQPGSPYNPASIRPLVLIGELSGGRAFKSEKWAERLQTPQEKAAITAEKNVKIELEVDSYRESAKQSKRLAALRARGGTF